MPEQPTSATLYAVVDPGTDHGGVIDSERLEGATPETVTGWGLDAATIATFPVAPQYESRDDAWKQRVADALQTLGYRATDTYTETRGLRWFPLAPLPTSAAS